MNDIIKYKKWDKKDIRRPQSSIRNILNLKYCQFYIPLMSLYFYIHNTPKSVKCIDFMIHIL